MKNDIDLFNSYTRVIRSCKEDADALVSDALQFFDKLRDYGYFPNISDFFFRLALDETVANALEHGNRSDPGKKIVLTIEHKNKRLIITVTDDGNGFDPDAISDPKLAENRCNVNGRGICLLKSIGKVSWNNKGNRVRVEIADESPQRL